MATGTIDSAARVEVKRRSSHPSDNLGLLQRAHPQRAWPFGRLVHMADSMMQPMRQPGFGIHPHENVEVVSYAVDGTLADAADLEIIGAVAADLTLIESAL